MHARSHRRFGCEVQACIAAARLPLAPSPIFLPHRCGDVALWTAQPAHRAIRAHSRSSAAPAPSSSASSSSSSSSSAVPRVPRSKLLGHSSSARHHGRSNEQQQPQRQRRAEAVRAHLQASQQCVECGAPATVQCDDDECNSFLCAAHDRQTHTLKRFAQHQRTPVAHTNNIAPLTGHRSAHSTDACRRFNNSSGHSNAAAAATATQQRRTASAQTSHSNIAPLSGSSGSGYKGSNDAASNNSAAAAASASAPVAADYPLATIIDTAVNGIRLVAQRDEQGRAHGIGCEVDATGEIIADRWGVWSHGLLLERRSMPLSLMPADLFTEARAYGAVLLRDDGSWYRGPVDEQYRPNGEGCWFEQVGLITIERTGRFDHGSLAEGTLHYPNGVKYEGQLMAKTAHGHGTLSHSRDCEWSYDAPVSDSLKRSSTATAASAEDSAAAPAASAAAASSARMGDGEEKKDEPSAAVRYVGERDPLNLPHGFGCELDEGGRMIEGSCGRWIHGSLAFERELPLLLMPPELFEKERARGATLLWSTGEYRGELDSEHRPHGEGCWLSAVDGVLEKGTFDHGVMTTGFVKWVSGDSYRGEWKDGLRHGEGKLISNDLRTDEGTWREGELVSGKRNWPDREAQQGTFVDCMVPRASSCWPTAIAMRAACGTARRMASASTNGRGVVKRTRDSGQLTFEADRACNAVLIDRSCNAAYGLRTS